MASTLFVTEIFRRCIDVYERGVTLPGKARIFSNRRRDMKSAAIEITALADYGFKAFRQPGLSLKSLNLRKVAGRTMHLIVYPDS